jgi:MFS family permease
MPLYISSFFQSLVFWYAIEKVFMVHIGFTATLIAVDVIVMNVVGLVLNIPSGILADRWSRKGIVTVAISALVISSLLLGLSHSVLAYIIFSALFGVYFGLHDGVYDSMIYDTLLEENKSRKGFEKYLGYYNLCASAALIIGSLLGAIIGSKYGLKTTYFLSLPGGIVSIIALFFFKEPKLHKKHSNVEVFPHIKQTFGAIFQRGYIAWILVALLASAILFDFTLEIDQLWPLALHLKLIYYGPLNALLLAGYGIGGGLATLLLKKRVFVIVACVLGLVSTTALLVHNMLIIAAAQFGVVCLFVSLYTMALGKLHDTLPSRLRSSSSSTVNMLTSVAFIPLVFVFGNITQHRSVFVAARMLIPVALLSVIGFLLLSRRRNGQILTLDEPEKRGIIPNPTVTL